MTRSWRFVGGGLRGATWKEFKVARNIGPLPQSDKMRCAQEVGASHGALVPVLVNAVGHMDSGSSCSSSAPLSSPLREKKGWRAAGLPFRTTSLFRIHRKHKGKCWGATAGFWGHSANSMPTTLRSAASAKGRARIKTHLFPVEVA